MLKTTRTLAAIGPWPYREQTVRGVIRVTKRTLVQPQSWNIECVRLPRWITQNEYDKKARGLKDQQAEIGTRIEQHQGGNNDFRTTLETLISLASRAVELFERSKVEQKRQLIAFVFSNCV